MKDANSSCKIIAARQFLQDYYSCTTVPVRLKIQCLLKLINGKIPLDIMRRELAVKHFG